jgi:hypothetical protein
VAYLKITYGEYTARCECCTTFRNTPDGVLPKAHYDNKVRDLVLDRIIKDGMSIERILESLRREFLLELSSGFVYNVLRDRAEELDMSEHRRMVLEHFSGTLCVDELHLGRFTLLLATDPLSDLPVAFALVAANDQDHMWRWLIRGFGGLQSGLRRNSFRSKHLAQGAGDAGFLPQLYVTPGVRFTLGHPTPRNTGRAMIKNPG